MPKWINDAFNTIQWLRKPLYYYLSRMAEPDYKQTISGWRDIDFVTSMDLINEIFKNRNGEFSASAANDIMRPLLGDYSTFTIDGELHSKHREFLQKNLSETSLSSYFNIVEHVTSHTLERYFKKRKPACCMELSREITIEIILKVLFGRHSEVDSVKFSKNLDGLIGKLATLCAFMPNLRLFGRISPTIVLEKRKAELDSYIVSLVKDCIARGDDCLLQRFISEFDYSINADAAKIRDFVITIVVAGHDTVATALFWLIYFVITSPSILSVAGEYKDDVQGYHDDKRVKRFIDETLRLANVVDFMPRVKTSAKTSDCPFAQGKPDTRPMYAPAACAVHLKAENYADPLTFEPRRPELEHRTPSNYFPFGGGRRRCVGVFLTYSIYSYFLYQISLRFKLTPVSGNYANTVKAEMFARRNVTLVPNFKAKIGIGRHADT